MNPLHRSDHAQLAKTRNIRGAQVLRVLDALQTDELCPCNWQKGDDVLKAA